jgi:hypothetical protein
MSFAHVGSLRLTLRRLGALRRELCGWRNMARAFQRLFATVRGLGPK